MRVLVDTSVWSLSLRKDGPADHPAVRNLSRLLKDGQDLFLTGIILQEVLQAFRAETTFRRVARHLEPFPLLSLERAGIVEAAGLYRRGASKGIAVSTVDCEIATTAILNDCTLLTADRDFQRMARVCDLNLL